MEFAPAQMRVGETWKRPWSGKKERPGLYR